MLQEYFEKDSYRFEKDNYRFLPHAFQVLYIENVVKCLSNYQSLGRI